MGLKVAVVGGGSTYTPELVEGFARRAVGPAHRRARPARPRSGPAGDRRRARRADPREGGLAGAADAHRRPVRRPRRRLVHAHPAAGRRAGGPARRRDAPPPVRRAGPGDDRPGRVREGAADGPAGARHRRGGGLPGRTRLVDPRLHEPRGDRHAGAAGRRAPGARAVQRGDRVPALDRGAVRGHAGPGPARPRRAQPPVVDPGGVGGRRRPAAGAARGRRPRGDRRRRLRPRPRPDAARDPVLLPALLLRARGGAATSSSTARRGRRT